MKEITDSAKKALLIIARNPGISTPDFGKLMWPDSPLLEEPRSDGKVKGWKITKTAQGYLARLLKSGLIIEKYSYHNGISKVGRKFFLSKRGEEIIDSNA